MAIQEGLSGKAIVEQKTEGIGRTEHALLWEKYLPGREGDLRVKI